MSEYTIVMRVTKPRRGKAALAMSSLASPRERFTRAARIAQDDVLLLDYAYAEELEPSRWNPEASNLRAHVAKVGGPANLPPELKQHLIALICAHREPMLGFLLHNPTTWFEGHFDADAIGALRLTRWFDQPQFASARTIDELLDSLGGATYAKLDFELAAMRGRPIMVAPTLSGPYCLIEGTARCCEIVRLVRRRAMPQATVPFVLAVCPDIEAYAPFHMGAPLVDARPWWVPVVDFLKGTLLTFAGKNRDGDLVAAVGKAWRRILQFVAQYPDELFRMSPREFETFIAGCYDHDGYLVTLTPRSGDLGRDVIAEKPGVGTIRVLDQVKQYKPGQVVTAEEVRAFLFVANADAATKCFITTTATFAPRLETDRLIAPKIRGGFLELRNGQKLTEWLRELETKR